MSSGSGAIIRELKQANAPIRSLAVADLEPMLASPGKPFSDPAWIYEMKYDGYRMMVMRDTGSVRLLSRNGNDMTAVFPDIVAAVEALPAERFILDGEVVVQDDDGRPRFQLLQKRARVSATREIERLSNKLPATLYAFDLLAFDAFDARSLPLSSRKRLLQQFVPAVGVVRYSEHVAGRGLDFFQAAEAMGLEGMVAKRADSPYRPGRSSDWLKIRVQRSADFVVVGFKQSSRARGFGSFHVAAWRNGELTYAGAVGTGVTAARIDEAWSQARERILPAPACSGAPKTKDDVWVEPRVVCEVRYLEWTEAGNLRHPVFLRLRTDKRAEECTFDDDVRVPAQEVVTEPKVARRRIQPAATVASDVSADVKLSNLDKVLWPDDGYTKRDLIDYYRAVSPRLLPFLRDRPVVLTRFPDGIHGKSFFQKDAPSHAPKWLRTETIYSEGSARDLSYFVADDERSLVYLANSASIPLHIWASRVATIAQPDWCVLDLDPKDAPFTDVVKVALAVRDLCAEIRMPCYIKTSGSSGLHVLLPLGRQCTHDQARLIGELAARAVVREVPSIATIERVVAQRGGKVYVDYLQNGHGKLLVSPYCVRPLPGAPVSTPLAWREVTPELDIRAFTIRTVPPRLEKLKTDPLAAVLTDVPDLVPVLSALQSRLR